MFVREGDRLWDSSAVFKDVGEERIENAADDNNCEGELDFIGEVHFEHIINWSQGSIN